MIGVIHWNEKPWIILSSEKFKGTVTLVKPVRKLSLVFPCTTDE